MTQETTQIEVPNLKQQPTERKYSHQNNGSNGCSNKKKRKHKIDLAELIRGTEMSQKD